MSYYSRISTVNTLFLAIWGQDEFGNPTNLPTGIVCTVKAFDTQAPPVETTKDCGLKQVKLG